MSPKYAQIAWCIVVVIGVSRPAPVSGWTQIVPGIDYQEYTLPDPNNVFVARMDRHHPSCFIDTSLANGVCGGSLQTIGGQFSLYDGAITYWNQDWGAQSDVVVAINGDYWNTSTYIPLGPQIQGGSGAGSARLGPALQGAGGGGGPHGGRRGAVF